MLVREKKLFGNCPQNEDKSFSKEEKNEQPAKKAQSLPFCVVLLKRSVKMEMFKRSNRESERAKCRHDKEPFFLNC